MTRSRLPATTTTAPAATRLRALTRRLAAPAIATLATLLVAACATVPAPAFPDPLRAPNPEPPFEALPDQSPDATRTRPRVETGPTVSGPTVRSAEPRRSVPAIPATGPLSLSLDGVPLAGFISVVFGTELGFSLEIEQSVRARSDLVSLRLVQPESPQRLYTIAEEVLANYGVGITEINGILRFAPLADGTVPPRLVTTRSLPEVPASERPVFVAMPLNASEPGRVAAQVRSLYGAQHGLTIAEMVEVNALLISGPPATVQVAMEAVQMLDRTALRDKRSVRINPLYIGADVLARELRELLTAQGYPVRQGVGTGGVLTLVPVPSANALVIFSESDEALNAATRWVEELDQPSDESAGDGGVYLYAARHTTVETLVPVLEALVGGSADNRNGGAERGSEDTGTTALPLAPPRTGAAAGRGAASGSAASRATVIGGDAGQMAVDPIRNIIVFQGDAQRWRAIQGVLARLDQPARQVVIEVTIAEITLSDEFAHGVEWALNNIGFNNFEGPLGALGGGSISPGSVIWRPISSSGQVRAVLNLFARDSRVTILSTPRLLVKSGETASIDVGTEVPIITSQATAPDLPGTGSSILQSIQYRKTGVLLDIEAVVHSSQRVDLKLSQEVSEASQTDTSDISSPSIFSRRLATSLSLSDGESMLLGGLISSSHSEGITRVPLLGDIPGVGRLFQNRRRSDDRTELLMLITPYVVEDASQARAITDAIRGRFNVEEF